MTDAVCPSSCRIRSLEHNAQRPLASSAFTRRSMENGFACRRSKLNRRSPRSGKPLPLRQLEGTVLDGLKDLLRSLSYSLSSQVCGHLLWTRIEEKIEASSSFCSDQEKKQTAVEEGAWKEVISGQTNFYNLFLLSGWQIGQPHLACSAAAAQEAYRQPPPPVVHNGVVDYYELLGVDDDATPGEIKMAYRNLAKECHPDYLGVEGHNICVLLNEAYEILSSPDMRSSYNQQLQVALIDAMDDYTGEPISKWLVNKKMGKNWDTNEERAVFVDECSCIGCKQCVWLAPGVFRMESAYGRSRVYAQWANTEDEIQDSMDSCPVDCISWVHKTQLPALEYVSYYRTKRNNVANIMSGMGSNTDVFAAASQFLKARERREAERTKATRRSEQQEKVRRHAAASLMKKRGGWMANFGSYMEAALNGVARTVDASMDDDDVAPQVGTRKRHVPGSAFDDETGATIPPERALVRRE